MLKGNTTSNPGILCCPYKKPSNFRRFINWIKGKFKKRKVVDLFVMTVDEMSSHNGRKYPKELIRRELMERPHSVPFLVHFGRKHDPSGVGGEYPILENSIETAVGYVDKFRFEGNDLVGRMKFLDTDAGGNIEAMVRGIGPVSFRLAPAGYGNVSEDGTVQDDYHLEAFDLTRK